MIFFFTKVFALIFFPTAEKLPIFPHGMPLFNKGGNFSQEKL